MGSIWHQIRNLWAHLDPVWVKFSEELLKLRSGIIIILKVISSDADYKLRW